MAKFNPFNSIKVETPNTNQFDLSFDNKLTLDMGYLVPVLVQETIPGDYFNIQPEMLIRLSPMIFPIMHRVDATIHFFYVPNRIIWSPWEKFLAGEDVHPPYLQGDLMTLPLEVEVGSIYDYMGLPISDNILEKISALPFIAYAKIYNEYYQDQNNDSTYENLRTVLETLLTKNGKLIPGDFGEATYADMPIRKRCYEHDYFTSALPFAQKGDPVNIPLTLAALEGDANITEAFTLGPPPVPGTGDITANAGDIEIGGVPSVLVGPVEIDTSSAELVGTINQLRTAMQLQKFLEKNARSGTRYNELIRAHFGEDIGDARIDRPEYLGGIKNNVVISEVLQTESTTVDSPLGQFAGHGTAVVGGNNISYRCSEHGFIMGILSIVPKTGYMQGIDKKFSRFSYLDYYWKEFAHIGEQAILNKELYYDRTLSDNNEEFGYIPRYSEYKYNPSEAHGEMRDTMKDWHLIREFASRPVLNQEFVEVYNDKRIFAVQDPDVPSYISHIYFNIQAKRKIPFFTDPMSI